jgi:hypothetical protein
MMRRTLLAVEVVQELWAGPWGAVMSMLHRHMQCRQNIVYHGDIIPPPLALLLGPGHCVSSMSNILRSTGEDLLSSVSNIKRSTDEDLSSSCSCLGGVCEESMADS